jgi:RNA polymerase sigma-70 factor (ECF subfamily)
MTPSVDHFDADRAKKMAIRALRRIHGCAQPDGDRFESTRVPLLSRPAADPLRRHYREILGYVRSRVGSDEEAAEITQDVFAAAAEDLARSAGDAPPTLSWLYTVARKRLVDETRRRGRVDLVSLEAVRDPGTEEGYGEAVRRALDASLAEMTEGQRQVVVLRLIEGWSFREIADGVGVTEEACRMRFMRGLEQLRDDFEQEGLTP